MDWVGLSVFIIYLVVTGVVCWQYIKLRQQNKRLILDNAQMLLDRDELLKKLYEVANINSNVEQTEGFVRFLSESRDWAFQYIEGIQEALNEYDAALSANDAVKLNESYKKLRSFLPESNAK